MGFFFNGLGLLLGDQVQPTRGVCLSASCKVGSAGSVFPLSLNVSHSSLHMGHTRPASVHMDQASSTLTSQDCHKAQSYVGNQDLLAL